MAELFNAAKMLKGYNPSMERASAANFDSFKDGTLVEFYPSTLKPRPWVGEEKTVMVKTDSGMVAHAKYVAGCLIECPEAYLNSHHDEIYHCTPASTIAPSLGVETMMDHVDPEVRNGAFPRVLVMKTLPIGIPLDDIKNSRDEDVLKNYAEFFGHSVEDFPTDVEFVPSVKRASRGRREGKLFQSMRTIFALTDEGGKTPEDDEEIQDQNSGGEVEVPETETPETETPETETPETEAPKAEKEATKDATKGGKK